MTDLTTIIDRMKERAIEVNTAHGALREIQELLYSTTPTTFLEYDEIVEKVDQIISRVSP